MVSIKREVDLFNVLPKYGFIYNGNYNYEDIWIRKDYRIDPDACPTNGIEIKGDWDGRRIYFFLPYGESVKNKNVIDFIEDLVNDGLVEENIEDD